MERLLQDLRYGARMLVKRPGFTLIAIITLALGIGANTAIFSMINATLLRQLPVAEPEELLFVFTGNPGDPFNVSSYPDYVELRDQNQVFIGMACSGGITASLNSDDQAQAEPISGLIVSGNYFELLGVRADVGRTFAPDEDQTPGARAVVVISNRLWQSRFDSRPDINGLQIKLNGHSFTIIGVAPAGFNGTETNITRDIYVPMMMQAVVRPPRGGYSGEMNPDLLKVRGNRWLRMIARLKPGLSRDEAQAEMAVITSQQAEAYPDTNRNRIATLTPLSEGDPQQRGQLISAAGLSLGVVAIVLLIACANVANLLLARASSRQKEIAVRLALGASRWRLVRQLLTESVLLAVCGGLIGSLLAWWLIDIWKASPPPPGALPINPDFNLDGRVLLFTLLLSLLTGIVFGLAPALAASRPDLVRALKDDARASDPQRALNLRGALVIAQVALSLVLLISGGLFLRSLWRAQQIEPGFDAERILTAPLTVNLLRYTSAQGREFYRQVVERVSALPGVESASLARTIALGGGSSVRGLLIEGRQSPDNDLRSETTAGGTAFDNPNVINVNTVGLSYFQTLGIGLMRGRDFNEQDTADRPGVVIVNETFVKRHFPGEEVLGKRLSMRGQRGPWLEIVGIVRDSKYVTLGERAIPFAYLPLSQNHETGMVLHVRTSGDPSSLVSAVRSEIQSLDRNLPVPGVGPMTELLTASLYPARMGAVLLGASGLLALLLAAVGLYGVMSFSIARRTREIGVRMALGAQHRDVVRMVLKEGMALVGLGVALGVLGAVAATRLLASYLYDVSTLDVTTFAAIPVGLAVVALLACYIPAHRATRVDPMVALRYE
ncbi:MAG TPA: ABC transporter permease [Blastocatellia bacterium]|nr:ABC transporter permease [Blastocatellia bacterium]